eukprot:TRINITY_DN8586_c0_g1_i1.p1 TRINITY_DN8586_c0_g1~~TRINITY_DN8586_c0_g1_i1.p1  ORF type:complete len:123 (-),score=36.91 TRINITY_DN8586_c0_g1_i1:349-717(-)
MFFFFFFFKQKTAYEMLRSLVGSEMCIRDSLNTSTLALYNEVGEGSTIRRRHQDVGSSAVAESNSRVSHDDIDTFSNAASGANNIQIFGGDGSSYSNNSSSMSLPAESAVMSPTPRLTFEFN